MRGVVNVCLLQTCRENSERPKSLAELSPTLFGVAVLIGYLSTPVREIDTFLASLFGPYDKV